VSAGPICRVQAGRWGYFLTYRTIDFLRISLSNRSRGNDFEDRISSGCFLLTVFRIIRTECAEIALEKRILQQGTVHVYDTNRVTFSMLATPALDLD
jgi:hypothetical protein